MTNVMVPASGTGLRAVELGAPTRLETLTAPPTSRVVYAAAHVVPRVPADGGLPAEIDWDSTLGLRHRLWGMGLGVAESMDTSQRGMGLSWRDALELGRRTLVEARSCGGRVVVGVGTDSLDPGPARLTDIRDAYLRQIEVVEDEGGEVVMMASRQLAASVSRPDEYVALYADVLERADRPVVLHWLGDMFDPQLTGYWGASRAADAIDTIVALIEQRADRVAGIKVSVLDADVEVELRRRLPAGVRAFTGDDYHYVDLIEGDEQGHSDALLGAFAAVAPFASAALARLDAGDRAGYRAILGPTEALSRLIFSAPTQYYKVGIAWLAYLDGQQDSFSMLDDFQVRRSAEHLGDLVIEAARLGYFRDPDLTAARVSNHFASAGVS